MKLLQQTHLTAYARRQFDFWDDFQWYVTAHHWTTTASDSGTVAVGDAHGGIVTLTPSDGSVADNDETYLKSTNEIFKFDADATMRCGCLLQYTELNTNAANIMFGWMNAVAANSILDDGGGPAASFSGAVIYKVDGGTVWRCRSSIGTTYTDTITTLTAGGSSYQFLEIEAKAISLTRTEITYFIDGAQVTTATNGVVFPLIHTIDATSATEMNLFAGSKNGSAHNQTLLIDGMGYSGIR